MFNGYVDWFGGTNNKLNKINDCGYIEYVHNGVSSDIIFFRRDLTEYEQLILEDKRSKKINITFDIDVSDRQKRFATNININFHTFKNFLADYLKTRPHDDALNFIFNKIDTISEVDRIELIKHLQDRLPNIIITSSKLRGILSEYDRDSYILLILKQIDKVDRNLKQELLNEICTILRFVDTVIEVNQARLILCLYKEKSNIIVTESKLRSLLMKHSQSSYISLLKTYLGQVDSELNRELLSEIFKNLENATDTERNIYWREIAYFRENIEYKKYLWDIAPIEIKKELTITRFESFLKITDEFNKSKYAYESSIFGNWRQLYQLNEIDNHLINNWTGENTTLVDKNQVSASKAQMISARGAEKLVIQFYQELGYSVEDTSSHQITSVSQAWITGDIRLDSDRLLDVKNARTSPNTTSYSEFCVKRLKKESGKDVNIVAVLSPYLNGTEIESGKVENPNRDKAIKILGDFSETDLESFKMIFEDNLISINFLTRSDKKEYLPHWLFDYNAKFYENQIDLISQFSQLKENEIPDVDDCSILGIKLTKYLSLFIAVGRTLPTSWTENILDWQRNFIDGLINLKQSRISLPLVFLSLLTHFLSMLSSGELDNNYSPSKYKEILYSDGDNKHPLKIYDPLNTINDFCKSLQSIWDYREQAKLNEFKIFQFDGKGLLSGQRSSQDRNKIRLLAYCGGLNKDGSSCGSSPLVIGKNDTCKCNYLICEKCDSCSANCIEYKSRIEIKKLNQKKIPDLIRRSPPG
jgi:hypothetical protein